MNWQNLMNRLAPLRRQWDLAVLANLAAGTERPGDLIEAINAQAADGRRIGWKVLNDTLRRLERSGYVTRQEMQSVPRETRYWLRPPGHQLLAALRLLDTWYDDQEPGDESPGASSGGQTAGNCNESSGAARTPLACSLNAQDRPGPVHRQDEHAAACSHQPYPVPATMIRQMVIRDRAGRCLRSGTGGFRGAAAPFGACTSTRPPAAGTQVSLPRPR